ncbi:homoserine dehydrogenase [Dehalococcoidia bacterium]|nr:homoserine dehydrogenase [Dehalococcoidia bacterium]
MNSRREIGIGLLGLGGIGAEVARVLIQKSELISKQAGRPVALSRVLVKNLKKPRTSSVPSNLLTTDPAEVLDSPAVDIVVELIGGDTPAVDFIRNAIYQRKHVVTANKEVMATHGPEIIRLAEKQKVHLLYEASVGGGIPIIGPLQKDLLANDITSVHAIINGTTNYVMTKMSQEEMSFDSALLLAQELGYAEPNPVNDIDGIDAAFKLAVISSLAFHTKVVGSDVYREGIRRLSAQDFTYANGLGYTIKLLAVAHRRDDTLSLRVHPALVSQEHLLAKVDGAFNAIEIEGDLVGNVLLHGQGAGPQPTSSAVIGDILEVARNITANRKPAQHGGFDNCLRVLPIADLVTQYYMRLIVADRAGVLAKIATILGNLGISITSVIQKDADAANNAAEIVVMTHLAKEAYMHKAVHQMGALEEVKEVSSLIRVERWT